MLERSRNSLNASDHREFDSSPLKVDGATMTEPIILKSPSGALRQARLTTEHSSSSYGQKVLVLDDGEALAVYDLATRWEMVSISRDEEQEARCAGYHWLDQDNGEQNDKAQ